MEETIKKIYKPIFIVLAIGLSVILILIVWQSPSRGETFVKILQIIISWPMIVGLLGFSAGVAFKKEIGSFLERVGSVEFGGAKISSPPQQPKPDEKEKKEEDYDSHFSKIKNEMQEIRNRLIGTELEKKELELSEKSSKLQNDLITKVNYWFYEYLSLFLAPNTQSVLRWFAANKSQTKEFYELGWKDIIIDPRQRETIFAVLLYYELIKQDGILFSVTDRGRNFISHMDAKLKER